MSKNPLYTIGHGNRSAKEFLSLLKTYAIDYLIDVRSKPYSGYNPQYNKEILQLFLEQNHITYVFMGDTLGGKPKDPLCYDNGNHVDYNKVKNRDFFKKGISRLKTAYNKDLKVAIMCSESKPLECHRTHLISKVLYEDGLMIEHINEKGSLTDHPALMEVLHGKPGSGLFEDI